MDQPLDDLQNRLPNFLILGAAKAGTTALYELLKSHPEVFVTQIKEPHFFSNDRIWNKGVEHYLERHFAGAEGFAARGEATPHYLFYEKAAQRIAATLPRENQRFVVILRDPVARAYSLYWNMVREGRENCSFEEALELEESRRLHDDTEPIGSVRFQYFRSGCYARQLRTYFEYFPRSHFLVLLYEDLGGRPEGLMADLCDFLRVSYVAPSALGVHNAAATPRSRTLQNFLRNPYRVKRVAGKFLSERSKYWLATMLLRLNRRPYSYPPMNRETERRLRWRFREDVLDLQSLLNRDLAPWLC